MSVSKIAILVVYAVLIGLAVVAPESSAGAYSLGLLLVLAAVHAVEVIVFYKRCKAAGGSMAAHVLNVFLFGVFHIKELKAQG